MSNTTWAYIHLAAGILLIGGSIGGMFIPEIAYKMVYCAAAGVVNMILSYLRFSDAKKEEE